MSDTIDYVQEQLPSPAAPLRAPGDGTPTIGSVNGQLALLAALAAHGGRWLRDGAEGPAPELLSGNSTFQFVGSFTAELPSRGFLKRASTATGPRQWLTALASRGVTDLSLVTDLPIGDPLPRHVASAFSNSGTWALLATGKTTPAMWVIGWTPQVRSGQDSRIWSLVANQLPGDGREPPRVGMTQASDQLRNALDGIRAFAERVDDLSSWASWFVTAAAMLDDPSPTAPHHQDILPSEATLQCRQLAAAVVQGWVFGGMGSWNDYAPQNPAHQNEYQRPCPAEWCNSSRVALCVGGHVIPQAWRGSDHAIPHPWCSRNSPWG